MDVPKGTCYGQTDVPVAPTFEQEAGITCSKLRSLMPFDAVYSSPLSRARLLAAYCGFQNPIVDDRLMEMNMGDWEMQIYNDIQDPHLQEWYDDYMHQPTTGGEGFPQLYARVAQFLDELKAKPYRQVAIFAHAGVLVSAGIYAHLFPTETAWDHMVPYGDIQLIEI